MKTSLRISFLVYDLGVDTESVCTVLARGQTADSTISDRKDIDVNPPEITVNADNTDTGSTATATTVTTPASGSTGSAIATTGTQFMAIAACATAATTAAFTADATRTTTSAVTGFDTGQVQGGGGVDDPDAE